MRVTSAMLQRASLNGINRNRANLATIQEQASSLRRLIRPSLDPLAAGTRASLDSGIAENQQLARNQGQARARLGVSEGALYQVNNLMIRALAEVEKAANDSNQGAPRLAIAQEIESIHGELLALANTRLSGGHVFGGYAGSTAAFTQVGTFSGGVPPTVNFSGDPSEIEIEISDGVRSPTSLNGQRVFLGDGDGNGAPDAGRVDIFQTLETLWQNLQADNLPGIQTAIDDLQAGHDQILLEITQIGGYSNRVNGAATATDNLEFEQISRRTAVEGSDTQDLYEIFSDLALQENALQASLEVSARVLQQSLLDFL